MQDFTDTPTEGFTPTGADAPTDVPTDAAPVEQDFTAAPELSGIAPDDLEMALRCRDSGRLRQVARLLTEAVAEQPDYSTASPLHGRFELCTWAESAREMRATFRVIRAALDFLEADFVACETENREWMRAELARYDALQSEVTGSVAGATA